MLTRAAELGRTTPAIAEICPSPLEGLTSNRATANRLMDHSPLQGCAVQVAHVGWSTTVGLCYSPFGSKAGKSAVQAAAREGTASGAHTRIACRSRLGTALRSPD